MTNKEAVNWIINLIADIGNAEHSELWHYEQALTEIKEMLESEFCWIPVTERLPEDPADVLVTYVISRYSQVGLAFYDDTEQGWYREEDGEYVEIESHKKIIAWMPLPEPYKEVNENDKREG